MNPTASDLLKLRAEIIRLYERDLAAVDHLLSRFGGSDVQPPPIPRVMDEPVPPGKKIVGKQPRPKTAKKAPPGTNPAARGFAAGVVREFFTAHSGEHSAADVRAWAEKRGQTFTEDQLASIAAYISYLRTGGKLELTKKRDETGPNLYRRTSAFLASAGLSDREAKYREFRESVEVPKEVA